MSSSNFLICATIIASLAFAAGTEIACESVEQIQWSVGTIKTCYIQTSVIDWTGFIFSSSTSSNVGAIDAQDNRKIQYLPEKVGKSFPRLMLYNAAFCAIEAISRDNFKGLVKLEKLYLNDNQIKKISIDTFEDLNSLQVLYLKNNKIKYLNGQMFNNMQSLSKVSLVGNICINQNFNDDDIELLTSIVSQKCGFCETDTSTVVTICKISYQLDELVKTSKSNGSGEGCKELLEGFMRQTIEDFRKQLELKQKEVLEKSVRIRKLEERFEQ